MQTVDDPHPAVHAVGVLKVHGRGDTAVRALDHVSVGFSARRLTAVLGPSGSGKSTLMHCLAGLDVVDAGSVRIGQTELTGLTDAELSRLRRDRVGFVFQQFNLLPTMSAEENILLGLRLAGRTPDQAWYRTVVEALGLGPRLRHRPSELSGGQQQRVACARALVGRPDVVFADEPTGSLDSRSGQELLGFLRMSVRELGQTVVMVTHDPVAASYADHGVLLADGRIAAHLPRPSADDVLAAMTRLGA
ncbi:putative ABC transport system ATP-binding protein [Crossiella equi]|uniref:ABC transport system ATP-binding protein n=1 Tax=Crossiella equi TaxID=130796 RepID=A0ABS5AQR5_9PSEU|nr:ABC transporter ATP-binding protein [Crossiella equi]MBP2478913.1 putative ABC transport system ATP-binding protein [Crossiella equi]